MTTRRCRTPSQRRWAVWTRGRGWSAPSIAQVGAGRQVGGAPPWTAGAEPPNEHRARQPQVGPVEVPRAAKPGPRRSRGCPRRRPWERRVTGHQCSCRPGCCEGGCPASCACVHGCRSRRSAGHRPAERTEKEEARIRRRALRERRLWNATKRAGRWRQPSEPVCSSRFPPVGGTTGLGETSSWGARRRWW